MVWLRSATTSRIHTDNVTDCEWSLYTPSTETSTTSTIYYEPFQQTPTVGKWYVTSDDYDGRVYWTQRCAEVDPLPADRVPTPRQARAAYEAAARRRQQIGAAANGNAQRLLHSVLSAGQRAMLDAHKKFFVRGEDGNRYEILTTKQHENIYLVNELGRRLKRFCIYQSGNTPLADNHAAQKLLLESNIALFHQIANVVTLRHD